MALRQSGFGAERMEPRRFGRAGKIAVHRGDAPIGRGAFGLPSAAQPHAARGPGANGNESTRERPGPTVRVGPAVRDRPGELPGGASGAGASADRVLPHRQVLEATVADRDRGGGIRPGTVDGDGGGDTTGWSGAGGSGEIGEGEPVLKRRAFVRHQYRTGPVHFADADGR